jgi:hypothetical protein
VSENKKEKKRTANKENPHVGKKKLNSHLFDDPDLFLCADAPEKD